VREPRLVVVCPTLDALLVRRGAGDDERRPHVAALLRLLPFDAWGEAREAVFLLRAGRDAEAFDRLRSGYLAAPGLGADRELAIALSAHFWRAGLPEKAAAYSWLLAGRAPEDPTARPRYAEERGAASPGAR
ncbi:MAG: hypothetical protein ABFD84_13475, partial [Candidatus Polarisedimenticolia bacterium]